MEICEQKGKPDTSLPGWSSWGNLSNDEKGITSSYMSWNSKIIDFASITMGVSTKDDFITKFGRGNEKSNTLEYYTGSHALGMLDGFPLTVDLIIRMPIAHTIILFFNKDGKLEKMSIR